MSLPILITSYCELAKLAKKDKSLIMNHINNGVVSALRQELVKLHQLEVELTASNKTELNYGLVVTNKIIIDSIKEDRITVISALLAYPVMTILKLELPNL